MARRIYFNAQTIYGTIQVIDFDQSQDTIYQSMTAAIGRDWKFIPGGPSIANPLLKIAHGNQETGAFDLTNVDFVVDTIYMNTYISDPLVRLRGMGIFFGQPPGFMYGIGTGVDTYGAAPELKMPIAIGARLYLVYQSANTGACTLSLWGGSAVPIYKGGTTDLMQDDIAPGNHYLHVFDGTAWQISLHLGA